LIYSYKSVWSSGVSDIKYTLYAVMYMGHVRLILGGHGHSGTCPTVRVPLCPKKSGCHRDMSEIFSSLCPGRPAVTWSDRSRKIILSLVLSYRRITVFDLCNEIVQATVNDILHPAIGHNAKWELSSLFKELKFLF
jgi:hypothetical protein